MSDPNTNDAEPPLVTRVETPELPKPTRPQPGWFGAILWSVLFMGVQLGAAAVTVGAAMTLFALRADNAKQFLDDQLKGLASATDRNAPPEGRPPMPIEMGQSLAYGMLVAQFASLALILIVVPRMVRPDWKRQIGFRRPALLHVVLVVLLIPGFMIVPSLIQEFITWATGLHPPATVDTLNSLFSHVPWPVVFLAIGLGPAFVEEVWCRGFLGRGLCSRYGVAVGVILTSLLFALMHLDPSQALVFTLMGAYLHFVFFMTRSIWASILLHMSNNTLAAVVSLTGFAAKLNANPQNLTAVIYVASFSLVLFGSIALWTGRAVLEPVSTANEESEWWPEYPGISAPPSVSASGVRIGYASVSPAAVALTLVSFVVLVYLLFK